MDKKEKNLRLKQHLKRKAAVTVLLFLGVAAATFFFLRETNTAAAARELTAPTLPVLRVVLGAGQTDCQVNEMHGYVDEMDVLSMRETMTPVGEDGLLTFEADTYGRIITGVTYEIYSSEGYKVVASGSAAGVTADSENELVTFEVEVPESIGDGEYALRVILEMVAEDSEESDAASESDSDSDDADSGETGETSVNYYTTLMKGELPDYESQIAFIETFHENTFLASGETMMEEYFTASTTTVDYGEITLSNTVAAAMWGNLGAAQIGEASIDILDFSEGIIGSYRISFVVETESGGVITYYHAQEIFTVSGDGTTVLSYQRTMDEVFSPSSTNLTATRINLGIQSEDETEYMVKSGRVAFVNHGTLYLMYMSGYEITEVFSFAGQSITAGLQSNSALSSVSPASSEAGAADEDENTTEENADEVENEDELLRACYHEYDIRIISMDSDGSMKFMVYGYMNSGLHEGQVGIALYSYDSETLTTTEEIFLAYDKSYEYLKEVIGKIAYINSDGSFYLMIEDSLYYMDFVGRESVLMTDGLVDGSYMVNDDGDVVAWNEDGEVYSASRIRLVDLEEGSDILISAEDGKTVRSLGFIGTDFLYAISAEENLTTDDYGNTVYAAEAIVILDEEGNEKRRIEKDGYYLTDITITDNMISFDYSEKSVNEDGEVRFTAVGEDQVIGQATSTSSSTSFSHVTDDVKGRCLVLAYGSTYTFSNDLITQKCTVYNKEDDERKISTVLHGEQYYYAYGRGNLLGMYDSAAEAVEAASAVYGYVIDSNGTVVYRRGERQYYMYLLEVTVSDGEAILEAYTAGTALDLSGASLSILLEYVGQRTPVLVNTPDGWAMIVDYDSSLVGIRYLDTNKKVELEKADAEALFEEGGNVFVVIP
ncbi:MAG: hypothetical protein LUE29_09340 [Lachnospiraceae bacterium]|nr:hypothetical protein [Lachnospiraceae bacterium]